MISSNIIHISHLRECVSAARQLLCGSDLVTIHRDRYCSRPARAFRSPRRLPGTKASG